MFDYQEFEYALEKLKEMINTNAYQNIHSGLQKMVDIFEDVLLNKENSKYFKKISPYNVEVKRGSQIRVVNIEPRVVEKLRKEIEYWGVKVPLLVAETQTNSSLYELLNGNHRHQACLNSLQKDSQILTANYEYPCVVIDKSDRSITADVWQYAQIFLNHVDTKVGNNENDIITVLQNHARDNNLDLNNELDKESLVKLCMLLSGKHSEKGAKNVVTRVQNNIKLTNSSIVQNSPKIAVKNFVDKYKLIEGKKSKGENRKTYNGNFLNKKFEGCVEFVSMVGSNFDQRFLRDMRWSKSNPNKSQIFILSAQKTSGSVSVVISQRKEFFSKMFELFKEFGSKGIWCDYVVIDAQFRNNISNIEIDGNFYDLKAENIHTYKIITKNEIIQTFNRKIIYELDWIFTEDKVSNSSRGAGALGSTGN